MSRRMNTLRRGHSIRMPRSDLALVPYAVNGLVYWLDPERYDDPAALWTMNGSKVASAPSRESPSGVIDTTKTASRATDSQRPTINIADSAYGGRNTLSFSSAANQYLTTGAWAASVASPCTIYIVGEAGVSHTMVSSAAAPTWGLIATSAGGAPLLNSNGAQLSTATDVRGAPFVACGVVNGASSAIYLNDPTNAPTSGTGSLNAGTILDLRVGANQFTSGFLNGKIATVLVYQEAHDAATRTLLMQWLEDRYRFNRALSPYIVAGLQYWLDPDRYADSGGPGAWTMNSNKVATAVSRHAWNGVADTSKNVTQATDSRRPTINVADSSFNGRNTLSFTGNTFAQSLTSGAWTTTLAAPQTIYAVVNGSGSTADVRRITVLDYTFAANICAMYGATATGSLTIRGTTNLVTAASNISNGVSSVVGGVYNGASSAVYRDNASSGTSGTTGSDTGTGIGIGARSTVNDGGWDGKIATILVYSGAHTTAQRQLIMGYLGAYYGISVTL